MSQKQLDIVMDDKSIQDPPAGGPDKHGPRPSGSQEAANKDAESRLHADDLHIALPERKTKYSFGRKDSHQDQEEEKVSNPSSSSPIIDFMSKSTANQSNKTRKQASITNWVKAKPKIVSAADSTFDVSKWVEGGPLTQ